MGPEEPELRALLQGDHAPGEYDPQAVRGTSIRLDGDGECPHCLRPRRLRG